MDVNIPVSKSYAKMDENDFLEEEEDAIEDAYFMKIHKERENEVGIPVDKNDTPPNLTLFIIM